MALFKLDFSQNKKVWILVPDEGLSDEQREFLFTWINKILDENTQVLQEMIVKTDAEVTQ